MTSPPWKVIFAHRNDLSDKFYFNLTIFLDQEQFLQLLNKLQTCQGRANYYSHLDENIVLSSPGLSGKTVQPVSATPYFVEL